MPRPDSEQSSALVRVAPPAHLGRPAPPLLLPERAPPGLDPRPQAWTMRDVLWVGFRRKRIIVACFVCVMAAVLAFVASRTRVYESEMKILVRRGRTDQVVSPSQNPSAGRSITVTREHLNSEAQLIIGSDLARQIVESERLHELDVEPDWNAWVRGWLGLKSEEATESGRIRAATSRFARTLEVQPLLASNVIRVSYASPEPERSPRVLNTLGRLYIDKHLEAHRAAGALDFFNAEAQRYRTELDRAQQGIAELSRKRGVIDVGVEKRAALERLDDLEGTLTRIRGEIDAAGRRIATLEREQQGASARITTEVRTDPVLTAALREEFHALELKKIQLTQVFRPEYPQVQEVERQIVATQRALRESIEAPVSEETTDRDPTYDWVRGELTKARAELAALQATAEATAAAVAAYRGRTRRLSDFARAHERLEDDLRRVEENYLVYSRKREEARISEALDERHILNVSITDPPTTPILPKGPPNKLVLLGGLIAALALGGLSAAAAELLDSSLSRPDDVEAFLETSVLASFPLCDNALEGDV